MEIRALSDIRPAFPQHIPTDEVREKLLELLGLQPIPEQVEFQMESLEEQEDGSLCARVMYENCLGEAVPGILLAPQHVPREKLAGVLCMPGTSGSAERVADSQFHRPDPDAGPLVGWGRELARRGFATLSISVKICYGRGRANPQLQGKLLAPYGISHMGVGVDEALRGVRVLSSSLSLDPGRIGMTGMSLGGNFTWYSRACAPWLRCAVPICGGAGSMARVIHEGEDVERHGPFYYVPHMLRFFDHPEVVASCIAPRPFMMICPTKDEDMPRSGVDDLIPEVRPVYEPAGRSEYFKVYQPEGNHVFLIQYFEWMVKWFQRFLYDEETS